MDSILNKGLALLESKTGVSSLEGSYSYEVIADIAYLITEAEERIKRVRYAQHITEAVGEDLDAHAADYGFVRKDGIRSHGAAVFAGEPGAVVPVGTVIVANDTGLRYATAETGDVGDAIRVEAEDSGTAYNTQPGAACVLLTNTDGLSGVTLPGGTTGGTEPEQDDDLRKRLLEYIRDIPTSGNAAHYVAWAKSVDGVGNAVCIPIWSGPGTVKVVISDASGRAPDGELLTAVQDYIDTQAPIGAACTVAPAYEVPVTVSVRVSGSYDADALQTAIEQYFASVGMQTGGSILSYAKVGYTILSVDGVTDYNALLLNGSTDSIALSETELPVLERLVVV